ncbi:hypothetical protein K2173_003876 [Erythroxylum novogranatense]|uniref:UspA domain-containing protein n=1 Tax=Erythroxylum novogranatense TaxID=1862640 RepID=A0AAV8SJL6_9ROSI|nr:hypothetical protein K2173_003876 [Erythroxylum novogranatense]
MSHRRGLTIINIVAPFFHQHSAQANMALSRTGLPRLCVGRSMTHVRVRTPSVRSRPFCNPVETEQKVEFLGNGSQNFGGDGYGNNGNKVMVVVDASVEAKSAFEWALSRTVENQDTIVLLYVSKPPKPGPTSNLKVNLRAHVLLYPLKHMCERRRPRVQVETTIREGKEKGSIIVEEAEKPSVSLLVLGQRRRSSTMWRLVRQWRSRSSGCVAEYCIQNASCMAIAAYLITSKRHKNFWLLA